jgi:hypothetical protein
MNAAVAAGTVTGLGVSAKRQLAAAAATLLGLLLVPLVLTNNPTTNSLAMAGVPPGLVQAAHQASQLTGIEAAVLVAIARKETNLGQARTGEPDDLVPADIRAHVDGVALAPGGSTAATLELRDGRRVGSG